MNSNTRVLHLAIAALLFVFSFSAEAQQAKVAKIGELVFRDQGRSALGPGREAFRRQLRELGYVKGKNIVYETRSAEDKLDRFPALADELVRLKVDVLVASSTAESPSFQECYQNDPHRFSCLEWTCCRWAG